MSIKVKKSYKEGYKKGEGSKEGYNGEKGLRSSVKEIRFFLLPFFFSIAIARIFRAIYS